MDQTLDVMSFNVSQLQRPAIFPLISTFPERSSWRVLGPLAAINDLLMFGCSTAFLFLVLQKVWAQF